MADFTNKAALGTRRMNPSSMVPGSSSNAPQGGFRTQLRSDASAAGSGAAQMPSTPPVPPNAQTATGVAPNYLTPQQQMANLAEQLSAGGTPRPGQKVSSQMGRVPRVQLPMQTFEHTGQSGPMINDFHKTGAPTDMSSLPAEVQSQLPGQTAPEQKKSRTYKKEDFDMLSAVFKTLGDQ